MTLGETPSRLVRQGYLSCINNNTTVELTYDQTKPSGLSSQFSIDSTFIDHQQNNNKHVLIKALNSMVRMTWLK